MFLREDWLSAVRQWPTSTIVSAILGAVATAVARMIGIPTLDQLEWPALTGLGYLIIFFVSSFLCKWLFAGQWLASGAGDKFLPDLDPREMARYLSETAKWAERFNSTQSWFRATTLAVRDELRQGRRLRAQGRPSGKWGDGSFRYPADFIEREFWMHGDLNWTRILNADYEGDIDAWNRREEKSFDDIMFCRREVEAIWPARNSLRRWLRPIPFKPIERPPYGPPPWEAADLAEASAASTQASLPLSITKIDGPSYSRYSGLPTKVRFTNQGGESKEIEVDPPKLGIREVFISNISLTRSVTLRIALVITDKDGKSHKLSGEGKNSWGMALGHNDRATKAYQRFGAPPPSYIVSPVTIAPQQTVHGALAFIINLFCGDGEPEDEKILAYYVDGSTFAKPEKRFRYTLEIEDVVSGVAVAIPLPSDGYKGADQK